MKLKPCPFCGGKAETLRCEDVGWWAWCTKCYTTYGGTCQVTKKVAIEKWNIRHWEHALEARARLIAAAPELLAVCAEIRGAYSYFSDWDLPIGFEDRLNAALKKAGWEQEEEAEDETE